MLLFCNIGFGKGRNSMDNIIRKIRKTKVFSIMVITILLMTTVVMTGCSNGSSDGNADTSGVMDTNGTTDSVENGTSNGGAASGGTSALGSTGTLVGTISLVEIEDMFTNRDKEVGYDESSSVFIELNGDSIKSSSDTVQVDGTSAVISEEGTYIISGTLDDGMIIVNADDKAKIQLVLDNVDISSSTSAAIYVCSADKVFITLAANSENTLSNGGEYVAIDDNNIDAVIFSKEDLTLNGTGTMDINAAAGHGIVSKDDLVITGGTYNITAVKHGLSANDSIRIADGSFTIVSGKDGMHSENEDDTSLGFIYVADGSFDITAEDDGLSAGGYMQLDNGNYGLQCTAKALKAVGDMIINNGTYAIASTDDSVHSNSSITVNGGTYTISTGDDGFHADSDLTITGGNITITDSYEGLEGLCITISGGDISLVSSDDGINAAGGNDQSGFGGFGGFGGRGGDSFTANADAHIYISGGIINIDAKGDGIDSNGDLYISGGEVYVSGPEDGGNGALDYTSDGVITGGILVAAGASQMAQNMGAQSIQGSILLSFSTQAAGSTISLADSSGKEILSWQSGKTYSSVVISCPEIATGSTYTVTAGTVSNTVTMDSTIYGGGSGMFGGGMGGGQKPDGMGGRGEKGNKGENGGMNRGEMPSGEMPNGEMPSGDMPSGEMPSGEMPTGELPAGDSI